MPQDGTISKSQAIEHVAAHIDGPLPREAFEDRVLAILPSKAKNPRGSIRKAINSEHIGKDLLFLDEQTLVPMRGVRFRVPLRRQEVKRGLLFLYPSFGRYGDGVQ